MLAQCKGKGLMESIQKAPLGFEPRISCLLDRRFNQLSHGATSASAHYSPIWWAEISHYLASGIHLVIGILLSNTLYR